LLITLTRVAKLLRRTNCTFAGMNYLGHAYLSYNNPLILVGNMISDFVKGNRKLGYAATVQKGIELHRAIDAFTDNHAATARAKEIFRPAYRLYSAPIMDVLYDHFLANDRTIFSEASLLRFTKEVYQTLEAETAHLPLQFVTMFPHMRTENWLYHYRTPEGIQKSLRGLVRRASFLSDSETAFTLFLSHYDELRRCYEDFFPSLQQMAKQKLEELLTEF
jgi:acyl carrier protein phosphodiesterase